MADSLAIVTIWRNYESIPGYCQLINVLNKRLRRFPKEAEVGFADCSGGVWGLTPAKQACASTGHPASKRSLREGSAPLK